MTTKARNTTTNPKPMESDSAPAEPVEAAEATLDASAPDIASPDPAADATTAGDGVPMDCIVASCEETEADGLGVCREHFDAGWRFVKEPDGD